MASKCSKFSPNMFNKSKCQACFGSKEAHSSFALENTKASRKVFKCGYLFVSPNFDFTNPSDRTRRWQRRFFRLHDDGELTYCVDENIDTVPQGCVDMNRCTEIFDAESVTTHTNSIAVVSPEKTEYFKAASKEEIQWWQDVLVVFPNRLKSSKIPCKPNYTIANKLNALATLDDKNGMKERPEPDSCTTALHLSTVKGVKCDISNYATFRGVRSLKHSYERYHVDGMRRSSSLHDLSSRSPGVDSCSALSRTRFFSWSGDNLNLLKRTESVHGKQSSRSWPPSQLSCHSGLDFVVTTTCQSLTQFAAPTVTTPAPLSAVYNSSSSVSSTSSNSSALLHSSLDEYFAKGSMHADTAVVGVPKRSLYKIEQIRGSGCKQVKLSEYGSGLECTGKHGYSAVNVLTSQHDDDPSQSTSADDTDSNETDELKMARSSEISTLGRAHLLPGAVNVNAATSSKFEDSKKHWFMLDGCSLRYYKDTRIEDVDSPDGRIDLSVCSEVSEVPTSRNYGFKIKTCNGEYTLAAMASGIRSNWIKVIQHCMTLHRSTNNRDPPSNLSDAAFTGSTSRNTDDPQPSADGYSGYDVAGPGKCGTGLHDEGGKLLVKCVDQSDFERLDLQSIRARHSELSPSNGNKLFSVKEFLANLSAGCTARPNAVEGVLSGPDVAKQSVGRPVHGAVSKSILPIKRYVEGSDSMAAVPLVTRSADKHCSIGQLSAVCSRCDGKTDSVRRAKSPCARVRERCATRSPRLHSPPPNNDDNAGDKQEFDLLSSYEAASLSFPTTDETDSDQAEAQHSEGDDKVDECLSSSAENSMMIEILESEVDSLKEKLEATETQLAELHRSNLDLKSRLQKDSCHPLVQTMKRQLKETRDSMQKRTLEIDGLKQKLDMSMSKLAGTEKALSSALRDYKQEKDKFFRLSTEWNRRIRSLESQVKESAVKLDQSRESLISRDRECRLMEFELKQQQQKHHQHEQDLVRLMDAEHQYGELRQLFDSKEEELARVCCQLLESEQMLAEVKVEFEGQVTALQCDFQGERRKLQQHIVELTDQLHSIHNQEATIQNQMTSSMVDILAEKDEIIVQLEEKLIENDHKIVDIQEELQAACTENNDIVHAFDTLTVDKLAMEEEISQLKLDLCTLRNHQENLTLNRADTDMSFCNRENDGDDLIARCGSLHDKCGIYSQETKNQKSVVDANSKFESSQIDTIQNIYDIVGTVSSNSDSLLCDTVLNFSIREMRDLLVQLHMHFSNFSASLEVGQDKMEAIALAEIVNELEHRFNGLEEKVHSSSQCSLSKATDTLCDQAYVAESSCPRDILAAYRSLKSKFDQVVAEFEKLKQQTGVSIADNCQEARDIAECKNGLMCNAEKESMLDIEKRFSNLISLINSLDGMLSDLPNALMLEDCSQISGFASRMKKILKQLEIDIRNIKYFVLVHSSNPQVVARQDGVTRQGLGCLEHMFERAFHHHIDKTSSNAGSCSDGNRHLDPGDMSDCLLSIGQQLQEISEQLDLLEDDTDGSDDSEAIDDDGLMTEIRSRLSRLSEFVKQHSHFERYDWRMMQLLSAQMSVITESRQSSDNNCTFGSVSKEDLHAYADRLSLESIILSEMSVALEQKHGMHASTIDPLMAEFSRLNCKVLSLQQKLDIELRTMCGSNVIIDVLRIQADILAEKIVAEGQLCSSFLSQSFHISQEEPVMYEGQQVQPRMLAAEAVLRSQLDSYIGRNFDDCCNKVLSTASYLSTRSVIQGELTFALLKLKKNLKNSNVIFHSIGQMRIHFFECLKVRHAEVTESVNAFQKTIIPALVMVISRESEDMMMVGGSENVLEAVCSEVSTDIEKHIQRHKDYARSTKCTSAALRLDMIVRQLRADRDKVMSAIREQYDTFLCSPEKLESTAHLPVQSLDLTIDNFAELVSLCSTLTAEVDFISDVLMVRDTSFAGESLPENTDDRDDDGDYDQHVLHRGLSVFVQQLTESLRTESQSRKMQAQVMAEEQDLEEVSDDFSEVEFSSPSYSSQVIRESVFAAQMTFTVFKMKLLHEQEIKSLKNARLARLRSSVQCDDGQNIVSGDLYQVLVRLEEVLDTKYDDEVETLKVVAMHVEELGSVVKMHDWQLLEDHIHQLEEKVQNELGLVRERHETHLDLFKQEEDKLEHLWDELQLEHAQLEEHCSALESELRSVSNQHDSDIERMRQDVLTAVHAIKANETEIGLSDRVSTLTKRLGHQKDNFMVDRDAAALPLPHTPGVPSLGDKQSSVEEELILLKKEKDDALAEETRITRAALDAMKKAYEEELQVERAKYKECLDTMYNEDSVCEIQQRHQVELNRVRGELEKVQMHHLGKSEDVKLLEVKLGQTKHDYESHIEQLMWSNRHLDTMVNEEIAKLKDFVMHRPTVLTTGNSSLEEELYDGQINIRIKDAELQKLRSQTKNLENTLHRTTEEHRQALTQYLQAQRENQDICDRHEAEVNGLHEQLSKAVNDPGCRKPVRKMPSFQHRDRSPSPTVCGSIEHPGRESSRRRRMDHRDMRRSKSSSSLPYGFDWRGFTTSFNVAGKERLSQRMSLECPSGYRNYAELP